jgi:DNA-binding transcriptional LysR family regulator
VDNYNIWQISLPKRQSGAAQQPNTLIEMDNTALRYFLEVARSGSLSKASEHLYVAVSALSRQIAKLEEEVGAPLFERRPRGMVLSDAGRLLVGYAPKRFRGSATVAARRFVSRVRKAWRRIFCRRFSRVF